MPLITIITNVEIKGDSAIRTFVTDFSKFASQTIGKPEAEISVNVQFNPNFAFGGTFDPAVRLHVTNLWTTNAENAQKWSKAFFQFFGDKLGVPNNRGHFEFIDPGDEFIGADGSTVAANIRNKA